MKKGLKFLLNKWTLIIAAILLVGIAGAVTALNWNNWFGAKNTVTTTSKEIYWNVDRDEYAYQSDMFTSSRDPDKDDGYYHVLFSNLTQQGRAVTRRVESKKVVDKIDSMRAMALVFDEDNIVVDAIPIDDLGYSITLKRAYVISQKDGAATLNTSSSLDGISFEEKIPAISPIFDVCGASGEIGDKLFELKEGDCIWGISDSKGIKYILLADRLVPKPLYWHVDRKWNSTLAQTTREKDADGNYNFLLAVEGEQKWFKCNDYEICKSIDGTAVCFGLDIAEDGQTITAFHSQRETTGGYSIASYYTLTGIEGRDFTATYPIYGKEDVTGTFTRGCPVYDVSGNNGVPIGAKTTLQIGDKIHGCKNTKGNCCTVFVVNRTGEVVKEAPCSHCGKTVKWFRYNGDNASMFDGHYILTDDVVQMKQFIVGAATSNDYKKRYIQDGLGTEKGLRINDCVIDLNGHKIVGQPDKRVLLVGIGSKLTLMDSVGTGVVRSDDDVLNMAGIVLLSEFGEFNMRGGTIDMTGTKSVGCVSGAIISLKGGVINMYGGTVKNGYSEYGSYVDTTGKTVTGGGASGNIYLSSGGDITTGSLVLPNVPGAVMNMYGGTVTGGKVTSPGQYRASSGGNFYYSKGAQLNIMGGTISNGYASAGGNINTGEGGKLVMKGGVVTGGTAYARPTATGGLADGYGGNIITRDFEFSGGEISEGTAEYSYGGNLCIMHEKAIIKMTGGTIRDGRSRIAGAGNVAVWYQAGRTTNPNERTLTLDLAGGTITQTHAPEGISADGKTKYRGGGIYFVNKLETVDDGVVHYYNPIIRISGPVKICDNDYSDVKLDTNRYLDVTNASGANIGITCADGMFAPAAERFIGSFFANEKGANVCAFQTDLWIGDVRTCNCPQHNGAQTVFSSLSNSTTVLNKDNRHFYLAADRTDAASINIGKAVTNAEKTKEKGTTQYDYYPAKGLVIDLNGHTIVSKTNYSETSGTTGRAIYFYPVNATREDGLTESDLTIMSTDGKGNVLPSGTITSEKKSFQTMGLGVFVRNHGTLNLLSGNIDMTGVEIRGASAGGVAIYNEKGGTVNMYEDFNIKGGSTTYAHYGTGTSTGAGLGGAVYNSGVFNMKGGVIDGGEAYFGTTDVVDSKGNIKQGGGQGGAVYNSGTFNLEDGVIKNGKVDYDTNANSRGGGGNVKNTGTFNMSGGEITYDELPETPTASQGANLYNSGTFTTIGGKISNGYAQMQGGGVWTSKKVNSSNLTVDNCKSVGGGGIFVFNCNDDVYDNLNIMNCSSTTKGGSMLFYASSSVASYSCTIKNSNIVGGTVTANTTTAVCGGNIAIYDASETKYPTLTLENTVVSDGQALTTTTAKGYGGNIAVGAWSTLVINGENSEISGGKSMGNGGNIATSGTVILNDGTIKDGKAAPGLDKDKKDDASQSFGGNLSLWQRRSYFKMTGGTIKDGQAKVSNSGNIAIWYLAGAGKLSEAPDPSNPPAVNVADISGGLITATKDVDSGYYGGMLLVNRNATEADTYCLPTVTLSGSIQIKDNKSADLAINSKRFVKFGTFSDDAIVNVYFTGADGDTFAYPLDTEATVDDLNDAAKFFNVGSGKTAVPNDSETGLKVGFAEHKHCICGGNSVGATTANGHTCDNETVWKAISGNVEKSIFTDGGNFYLTADTVVNGYIEPAAGATLNVCLNGYKMARASAATNPVADVVSKVANRGRLFQISKANVTVNVCDCSTGKTGTIIPQVKDYKYNGGVVFLGGANDTFNFYGGTIVSEAGGVKAFLNSGDTATDSYCGGLIHVNSAGAKINIYDGTLNGLQASCGGVIYSTKQCAINIFGGTLQDGTAAGFGGSTTKGYGGNIYLEGGSTLNIYKDAVIKNGKANYQGGNIYVTNSTVLFKDATIIDGFITANSSYCGNVYLGATATTTIDGGTYTCTASAPDSTYVRGGGIIVYNGNTTVKGSPVIGSKTFDCLYITKGKLISVPSLGDDAAIKVAVSGDHIDKFADDGAAFVSKFTSALSDFAVSVDGAGLKTAAK